MKRIFFITFVLSIELCLAQQFIPNDIRLGDTTVNYVNPEISPIGNYMLWIEVDTSTGSSAKVWHCEIDPNTGDLIPSNGKGYNAFVTNLFGRPADWGIDSIGLYYIGINLSGKFVFVRPTSATTAETTILPTPSEVKRRAIYPSQLPGINKRFITYVVNNNVIGGASNPLNDTFYLRFLDLDNPLNEYLIETQTRTYPQFAGFDIIVPRWMKGTPYMIFGFKDVNGNTQAKEFYAYSPTSAPIIVSNDSYIKVDGFPVINPANGNQYLLCGINQTDSAYFYKRTDFSQLFIYNETVKPISVHLENPSLNQSHEPFLFSNQLYSCFQINEAGGSFLQTTFSEPGEIWLTSVDISPQNLWLISEFDSSLAISEPEPYVGNNKAWVYYSATKIDTTIPTHKKLFQLRRCDTPMNGTSSVEENNNSFIKHQISVYPNPTKGIIHIGAGNLSDARITIYNAIGEVVKVIDSFDYVDLTNVVKGIYFVEVKTKNDLFRTKIIKQ